MNGLLCCAEILAVLLFIPWSLCQSLEHNSDNALTSTASNDISENKSTTESESQNSEMSTDSATSISTTSPITPNTRTTRTTPTTPTTPTTTTTAKTWEFSDLLEDKTILTCAALILACAILLISTLALACKVCQLRRRLRAAGGDSEYWMGMDKTSKAESQPEAKENAFLLTENGQTTREGDNGATEEAGGKVDEVKQQGDEKEVGDSQKSEGAAAAAAPEESSPPSKPAEETTKDPPPPSSSENTEEPKKEQ
ncbi:uncharacterized protein LOC129368702 [Poeciliopsis prolifica]|uniref:uncharacterized protein LOC129368702 n=1 Tax=Poeciliopsis prolifica TaxID=188132 RepID=UPI0024134A0B|nr:uncharacterized protein LOC129368702 [Poeciliopsis prolifica]